MAPITDRAFCQKVTEGNMSDLFEILNNYCEAAARSSSVHTIATAASEFLNSVQTRKNVITQSPKLSGLLVYKCLRMFQEVESWSIMFKIESPTPSGQIQSVLANLRSLLSDLFKVNGNFSKVCGKEFLRIILDRPLIQEHMPNCKIDKFIDDADPDPDFIHVLVPRSVQQQINEVKISPSRIPEIATSLMSSCNQNTVHLYLGDLIRYIMLSSLEAEHKTSFILALIDQMPDKEDVVTSFEVGICLCIDIFTFTSKSRDRSAVKAFFDVYEKYHGLLYFIERVAKKHSKIPYAVASAMQACKVTLPSTYVQWPEVEMHAPAADTASILNDTLEKMRWKRDSSSLLETCIGQLMTNVMNKGVSDLDIPVKKNSEITMILNSERVPIISALCAKSSGIFKLVVYELGMKKKYHLVEEVIAEVLKGPAADTVLPTLSKVLVIVPEMVNYIVGAIAGIPETIDPSPFIRFICYNCTANQIVELGTNLVFPVQEQMAIQLFRESVKWRQIPQGYFWMIVRKAYVTEKYQNAVLNGIRGSFRVITDSTTALTELKMFLRKTRPLPIMAPLMNELVKGPESILLVTLAMIKTWFNFYPNETTSFIKKKREDIQQMYNRLPKKYQEEFPQMIVIAFKGM